MRSLRRDLALRLCLGMGVLMLAAGMLLHALFARWLREQFDRALLAEGQALASLTDDDDGVVELDLQPEAMPEFGRADLPHFFELWVDGRVLARSRSLGARDLARAPEDARTAPFDTMTLPDGRPGRRLQMEFVPRADEDDEGRAPPSRHTATLVVARGVEPLVQALSAFRLALTITGVGLLLATLALVRLSIGAALRPLDQLGRQVQGLTAASLGTRLAMPVPVELEPLVAQLDALLHRLDDAFQRERRLTSDLAHELRTPVAELRALSEVGMRWPSQGADTASFFQDVHDVARHMEQLIADLLILARHEGGLERATWEPVPLAPLLREACASVEARGAERGTAVECDGDGVVVWSDRPKLLLVVHNLLRNAVELSPARSIVHCRADGAGARPRLVMSNPAPELAPEDLPRMFERFWRKDPARTGDGNAGLGLSVVGAFAEVLRLDVVPELRDGTLSMTVLFPEAVEPAASSDSPKVGALALD